jgi:HEAT repeat protein
VPFPRFVDPLYFRVREGAQNTLMVIGEPAVEALRAALNHTNTLICLGAATILSRRGDEVAIDRLNQLANDCDADVSRSASAALRFLPKTKSAHS